MKTYNVFKRTANSVEVDTTKQAKKIVLELQKLNNEYFSPSYPERHKDQLGSFIDDLNNKLDLLGYKKQYGNNMRVEKK